MYLFKIPCLGWIASFLQTRTGWFAVIVLPATLLVIWIVIEIFREASRHKETDMKQEQQRS
jgi:hypothetical protein